MDTAILNVLVYEGGGLVGGNLKCIGLNSYIF